MKKIYNYGIIEEEITRQNKGCKILSDRTGLSIITIQNIRKGKGMVLSSLLALCDELGLKVVIERNENNEKEPVVKTHGGKVAGIKAKEDEND